MLLHTRNLDNEIDFAFLHSQSYSSTSDIDELYNVHDDDDEKNFMLSAIVSFQWFNDDLLQSFPIFFTLSVKKFNIDIPVNKDYIGKITELGEKMKRKSHQRYVMAKTEII